MEVQNVLDAKHEKSSIKTEVDKMEHLPTENNSN